MSNEMFGQMGFDFGFDSFDDEDADFTPIKKEEKKPEKKAAAAKSSTTKKSVSKNNGAKKVKLEYPVTFIGRSFRYTVEGEGETTLQEAAEKLYEAGFKEVAHEAIRFVKTGENEVVISYENLAATSGDTLVKLPVTVIDGQKIVEYSEMEEFDMDDDDELSVEILRGKGMNDDAYEGMELSYDPTSGIALPIFEECENFPETAQEGDTLYCMGRQITITDPAKVVEDHLGELPEKCKAVFANPDDGLYFLYLKPESFGEKIDRSKFEVKNDAKIEKVKEKFNLPIKVWIPMFNQEIEVLNEDTGWGAQNATWEEILEFLKTKVRALNSSDRKVDHMYIPEEHKLCVAIYSGTKGAMPQTREEVERFVESLCIPESVLSEIVSYFAEDLSKESIVQVWRENGEYKVVMPCKEDSSRIHISYTFPLDTRGEFIGTIHSHNTMPAFFSGVDDKDELEIPGLYGVIGRISDKGDHYDFESRFRFTLGEGKAPVDLQIDKIFKEVA